MEAALDRLYLRLGPRYFAAYRWAYLGTGVLMCVIAGGVFSLYEEMTLAQFAGLVAVALACTTLALGWGAVIFKRTTDPIEAWIRDGRNPDDAAGAWRMAEAAPRIAIRQQLPRAVLLAALPVAVYVMVAFDLSVVNAVILFVAILAAATYPTLLHFFGLELYLRPVLRDLARYVPQDFRIVRTRFSLRSRLFVGLVLINTVTGIFVSVFSAGGTESFQTLGSGVAIAIGTSITTSLLLVALLAQTMLGPVSALVGATRRIRLGDLNTRVPVMTQDELGILTASFNEMTGDLQRSRERLVSTREEERRRLRRDLHDGLGPTLAAIALQLDAAGNVLDEDPGAAQALLGDIRGQAQGAIADLRRLVYDLRPPQLDELGLVRAIEGRAASFTHTSGSDPLAVAVHAPRTLPPLPAAVEVAAFRIVEEALTNVVKHARARNCVVSLRVEDRLELAVADDGTGPNGASTARPGVGLASMRERAAELGGACTIGVRAGGGTLVRAVLPLVQAAPDATGSG